MQVQDVVSALAESDLADVRVGDIRLPYDNVFVAFEKPVQGERPYTLEGAYLHTLPEGLWVRLCFLTDRAGWPQWLIDPGYNLIFRDPAETLEGALRGEIMRTRQVSEEPLAQYASSAMQNKLAAGTISLFPNGSPTSRRYQDFVENFPTDIKNALSLVASAACILTQMPPDLVGPKLRVPARAAGQPKADAKGALECRFIAFANHSHDEMKASGAISHARAHWRRGDWRRQPYLRPMLWFNQPGAAGQILLDNLTIDTVIGTATLEVNSVTLPQFQFTAGSLTSANPNADIASVVNTDDLDAANGNKQVSFCSQLTCSTTGSGGMIASVNFQIIRESGPGAVQTLYEYNVRDFFNDPATNTSVSAPVTITAQFGPSPNGLPEKFICHMDEGPSSSAAVSYSVSKRHLSVLNNKR